MENDAYAKVWMHGSGDSLLLVDLLQLAELGRVEWEDIRVLRNSFCGDWARA